MRRAALLALLLCACQTTAPGVGLPPPQVGSDAAEAAYQQTLARFSDHQELYSGFDTKMFAEATYQSPAFREARVKRQARFQEWPPAKLQQALLDEQTAAKQSIEFFFGAFVNDYHFDDFDRSNSVWRIALVTPEGQVGPLEVKRVGRADENMRAYYPYMSDFWVAYRIRFPLRFPNGQPVIPEGLKKLRLRVASSLGRADLVVAAH